MPTLITFIYERQLMWMPHRFCKKKIIKKRLHIWIRYWCELIKRVPLEKKGPVYIFLLHFKYLASSIWFNSGAFQCIQEAWRSDASISNMRRPDSARDGVLCSCFLCTVTEGNSVKKRKTSVCLTEVRHTSACRISMSDELSVLFVIPFRDLHPWETPPSRDRRVDEAPITI